MNSVIIAVVIAGCAFVLCVIFVLLYYYRVIEYFKTCFGKSRRNQSNTSGPFTGSSLRGDLIRSYKTNIEDDYYLDLDHEIGKGGCGIVIIGESKVTHTQYAIKVINKANAERARLERELKLLKDVDHTNIVRLFSVYDAPTHIHFVMELCQGGHLGNLISRQPKKYIEEEWAKVLSRQILSAVAHIHSRGIAHRDIKLQNILVDATDDRTAQLKLIDFGYGSRYIGALPMRTKCGTPYTTAPEVIREHYDERCDIWSTGVVIYIMLCGKRPFEAPQLGAGLAEAGKAAMTANILAGRYHFNHKVWNTVSRSAISFVRTLLHPDYTTRVHAHEALDLPWLKNVKLSLPNNEQNMSIETESFEIQDVLRSSAGIKAIRNIQNTVTMNELQRMGMMAVVFGLDPKAALDMRRVFQSLDKDASGSLSRAEFHEALEFVCPDLSEADVDILFDTVDMDGNHLISYTEFLIATIDPKDVDIEEFSKAFRLLDEDGNGSITKDEFYKVLKSKYRQIMTNNSTTLNTEEKYYQHLVKSGRVLRSAHSARALNAKNPIEIDRRSSSVRDLSYALSSKDLVNDPSNGTVVNGRSGKFTQTTSLGSSGKQTRSEKSQFNSSPHLIQPRKVSMTPQDSPIRYALEGRNTFPASEDFAGNTSSKNSNIIRYVDEEDELEEVLEEKVNEIFNLVDVNGDGVISYGEFIWAMTGLGFPAPGETNSKRQAVVVNDEVLQDVDHGEDENESIVGSSMGDSWNNHQPQERTSSIKNNVSYDPADKKLRGNGESPVREKPVNSSNDIHGGPYLEREPSPSLRKNGQTSSTSPSPSRLNTPKNNFMGPDDVNGMSLQSSPLNQSPVKQNNKVYPSNLSTYQPSEVNLNRTQLQHNVHVDNKINSKTGLHSIKNGTSLTSQSYSPHAVDRRRNKVHHDELQVEVCHEKVQTAANSPSNIRLYMNDPTPFANITSTLTPKMSNGTRFDSMEVQRNGLDSPSKFEFHKESSVESSTEIFKEEDDLQTIHLDKQSDFKTGSAPSMDLGNIHAIDTLTGVTAGASSLLMNNGHPPTKYNADESMSPVDHNDPSKRASFIKSGSLRNFILLPSISYSNLNNKNGDGVSDGGMDVSKKGGLSRLNSMKWVTDVENQYMENEEGKSGSKPITLLAAASNSFHASLRFIIPQK